MKLSLLFSSLVAAVLAMGSVDAPAQGLEDLFASPKSTSPRSTTAVDRSKPTRPEPVTTAARQPRLYDVNGSESRLQKSTAMEIRQARAMKAFRQRAARLDAARWAGNPTLRPNWDPMPQTASRYPSHRTLYVPVYLYQ